MSTQWIHLKPSDIVSKEESHRLRQRSDLMGFWLIGHCWGTIVAAMALYAFYPSVLTLMTGLIIVGGRQLGLAILMHEGSHGMLFRTRRLNETLTTWLCAAPMIIALGEYRKRHMAHHRFTRTESDPENYLYTPFPVSPKSMGRKLLRDLTGIAFLRTNIGLFRHIRGTGPGQAVRLWQFYGPSVIFNSAIGLAFATFGRFDLFLLLWVLPMATTYMAFLRIRNIAEHANVPDLDDPLKNSRTTLANWLERLTVAPYFVNYHIEHHLMPFIPCYRLPELHELLITRGYGERMNIEKGYLKIIRVNAGPKLGQDIATAA